MQICLVCNSDIITRKLKAHFGGGHNLEIYGLHKGELSSFDAVLIVEPYIVKGQYLSIGTIWKNYLMRHYPLAKLIVAGFNENDNHKNYLNLLKVDSRFNLDDFIEAAPVVEEDWEIAQLLNGYDQVIEKLKLFFNGHNKESIIDAISMIRLALNNVELSLSGSKNLARKKEPFETVWQKWLYPKRRFFQHFYSLWHGYKGFFLGLPFNHQIKDSGIEKFIEDLSWIFSQPQYMEEHELLNVENKYRQLDAFNRIGGIIKLFNSINTRYINPESVGNILLIDDDKLFHKQMKECFPLFTFRSIYSEEDIIGLSEKESFNLILLDLELKEGEEKYSGLDLIQRLKALYPATSLAIVTSYNERSVINHTIIEEGADFFFAKSTIDAEKWAAVFINLIATKRYSLGDVILFNQTQNWEEKPTILVVEDEKVWFNRYKELTNDYHFVQATNIQQAKDHLKTQSFDLVLLDLFFKVEGKPVQQGSGFLTFLKERYSNIPVFVISIDKSIEQKLEISKLGGVEKYIYKAEYDEVKWLKIIKAGVAIKKQKDLLNAS